MTNARKKLSSEQSRDAMRRISAWRRDPAAPVACPMCDAPGLAIADRSARPHAEWYALTCGACGLDDAVQIALGSPPLGGA